MNLYKCEKCGRYISADYLCPFCEPKEKTQMHRDWDDHDVDYGDNYGTHRSDRASRRNRGIEDDYDEAIDSGKPEDVFYESLDDDDYEGYDDDFYEDDE